VLVGGHESFDYNQLATATLATHRGARLYATSREPTFPGRDGPRPATGAVLAAVETATGRVAVVAGKPEPGMFTAARQLLPSCRKLAMVGDRLVTTRGVRLQLGGSVHDPTDPVGRLLFNVLAMVAEFESDLIKARTREGLAVARAAGKLRGRKSKLTPTREALLVDLHRTGQKSPSDLAELFGVGRSTVYRALERATTETAAAARPGPAK